MMSDAAIHDHGVKGVGKYLANMLRPIRDAQAPMSQRRYPLKRSSNRCRALMTTVISTNEMVALTTKGWLRIIF